MATLEQPPTRPSWRSGLIPALVGWIWARICVAVGFVVAGQTVDVLDNPGGRHMIRQGLFVWDGAYYRVLGQVWYDGANPDAARFFPVYPQLARFVSPLVGGDIEVSLLIISNVAALVGALVLWRLAFEVLADSAVVGEPTASIAPPQDPFAHHGGWRSLRNLASSRWRHPLSPAQAAAAADRSAWMVALFPAVFVFAFAYTESLALTLTAGTLLALRRKRFLVAALLALAAAGLRPVGGLLLVPIAIELWQTRPRPSLARIVLALTAPIAGLVGAFVWINQSTHDLMRPLTLQQQIRGGFQDPITRVLEPIGEMATGDFRDVYNFGFMVVLLFLGYQAVRFRQPLSWLAFSAASLVILLSSQVTDSLGRYGLVVVPFIIAGAQWADARWKQWIYAIGSSLVMVWIVSEAMIGRMVP